MNGAAVSKPLTHSHTDGGRRRRRRLGPRRTTRHERGARSRNDETVEKAKAQAQESRDDDDRLRLKLSPLFLATSLHSPSVRPPAIRPLLQSRAAASHQNRSAYSFQCHYQHSFAHTLSPTERSPPARSKKGHTIIIRSMYLSREEEEDKHSKVPKHALSFREIILYRHTCNSSTLSRHFRRCGLLPLKHLMPAISQSSSFFFSFQLPGLDGLRLVAVDGDVQGPEKPEILQITSQVLLLEISASARHRNSIGI